MMNVKELKEKLDLFEDDQIVLVTAEDIDIEDRPVHNILIGVYNECLLTIKPKEN